jgi:hypothetical protein
MSSLIHCAVNRVDYLCLQELRELPGHVAPILQMVLRRGSQCKEQLIPRIQQDQVTCRICIEFIWMSDLGNHLHVSRSINVFV